MVKIDNIVNERKEVRSRSSFAELDKILMTKLPNTRRDCPRLSTRNGRERMFAEIFKKLFSELKGRMESDQRKQCILLPFHIFNNSWNDIEYIFEHSKLLISIVFAAEPASRLLKSRASRAS